MTALATTASERNACQASTAIECIDGHTVFALNKGHQRGQTLLGRFQNQTGAVTNGLYRISY